MVSFQEHYYDELVALFTENNYVPEKDIIKKLAALAGLVVSKNEAVNLISRKDTNCIVENHIFISAYISKFLPAGLKSFLDIGTGGGLPGLPVSIVNPNIEGVLIDSTGKKINAVNEFIEKLKLKNASALNSRVEAPDFINRFKNSFDLILSRATVPLILLIKYALPVIKEKAYLAAIKGGILDEELEKALLKYKQNVINYSIIELAYNPTNIENQKSKKLVLLELNK